jgi:hypothetical protein
MMLFSRFEMSIFEDETYAFAAADTFDPDLKVLSLCHLGQEPHRVVVHERPVADPDNPELGFIAIAIAIETRRRSASLAWLNGSPLNRSSPSPNVRPSTGSFAAAMASRFSTSRLSIVSVSSSAASACCFASASSSRAGSRSAARALLLFAPSPA